MEITFTIIGIVLTVIGNALLLDWIGSRVGIRTPLHRFWKGG